jgi:WD40 repeat protein
MSKQKNGFVIIEEKPKRKPKPAYNPQHWIGIGGLFLLLALAMIGIVSLLRPTLPGVAQVAESSPFTTAMPLNILTTARPTRMPALVSPDRSFDLAWSPDDKILALTLPFSPPRLYNTSGWAQRPLAWGKNGNALQTAFTPDGKLLAVSTNANNIVLLNVATSKEQGILKGHDNYIRAIAFSPDSKLLASGSWDGTVRLWDTLTSQQVTMLPNKMSDFENLIFTFQGFLMAAGSTLVSHSSDGSITNDQLVNSWDMRQPFLPPTGSDPVTAYNIEMSPDGSRLAISTDDGTQVWSIGPLLQQTIITTLPDKAPFNSAMAFNPDGTLLAVVPGLFVNVWDVTTSQVRLRVQPPSHPAGTIVDAEAIAFSQDGQKVAFLWDIIGITSSLQIWDIQSQVLLSEIAL